MVSEPKVESLGFFVMETSKIGVEKFDGIINFTLWQSKMKAFLVQQGLKKALGKKPEEMVDEKWEEIDEKGLATIQLCLSNEVLSGLLDQTTTSGLWSKLASTYNEKSMANKIRLKEKLYTFRMMEGGSVVAHLNEFMSTVYDLEQLGCKIEEEDRAILLVVSLPPSFRHFKEILLYSNNAELKFDNVKSMLMLRSASTRMVPRMRGQ